jgi:uncharacterized membrane protein YsdA (DUF1294 family)
MAKKGSSSGKVRSPTQYFLLWALLPVALLLLVASLAFDAPLLPTYLVGINLSTFLLFAYDKRAAMQGRLRVPERVLLTVALLGGAIAALLAMVILRHKTIKWLPGGRS